MHQISPIGLVQRVSIVDECFRQAPGCTGFPRINKIAADCGGPIERCAPFEKPADVRWWHRICGLLDRLNASVCQHSGLVRGIGWKCGCPQVMQVGNGGDIFLGDPLFCSLAYQASDRRECQSCLAVHTCGSSGHDWLAGIGSGSARTDAGTLQHRRAQFLVINPVLLVDGSAGIRHGNISASS